MVAFKSKEKKKSRMQNIDYILFYSIMILLAVGIVMVYSASSFYAKYNTNSGDTTEFLKKQIFASILGLIAMFFFMGFDYHKLKKFTVPAILIAAPIQLAVFAFDPVKGARRWIKFGALSFQPSELAKYVVVLFLAMSLAAKANGVKKFWTGVMPYIGVGFVYSGLVLMQSNLSVAIIIMAVTFIMIFCAGGRIKHLFGYVAPILFALAACFAIFEPYRLKRLMSFTDPWQYASTDGYQLIQSFYALGAGGLTGLGLGQSRQKTLYMPEPHNDFIFSIIGEELGLIGCLLIITVFLVLIWRGITVAMEAKDTYGTLIAVGITSVIAIQCAINIAVVTGSMPVTGVPLPFISYGGTSLAITMAAMGILLNVSRQKNKLKVKN